MPHIDVRALSPDERDAFAHLGLVTFHPSREPNQENVSRRRARYEASPWFDPAQLRGAFLDGRFVGGYVIDERRMVFGPSRLLTGCIGAVAVLPEHRGRGVARALMEDALRFGEERRLALILLDGIEDFYARWGYADVHDFTVHVVATADLLAQPPSACTARAAMPEDAPALLDLYLRHHPRPGRFDRTLAEVEWRVRWGSGATVAVAPDGQVRGYSSSRWGPERAHLGEVAADDWPALLALLQAQLAEAPGREELWLGAPTGGVAYCELADRFTVRTESRSRPNSDWMARPGHLPTLLDALEPLLRERAERAGLRGTLTLEVDGTTRAYPGPTTRLSVTPQRLVQLVFGFRPAPAGLEPLFPYGETWMPGSDAF